MILGLNWKTTYIRIYLDQILTFSVGKLEIPPLNAAELKSVLDGRGGGWAKYLFNQLYQIRSLWAVSKIDIDDSLSILDIRKKKKK